MKCKVFLINHYCYSLSFKVFCILTEQTETTLSGSCSLSQLFTLSLGSLLLWFQAVPLTGHPQPFLKVITGGIPHSASCPLGDKTLPFVTFSLFHPTAWQGAVLTWWKDSQHCRYLSFPALIPVMNPKRLQVALGEVWEGGKKGRKKLHHVSKLAWENLTA